MTTPDWLLTLALIATAALIWIMDALICHHTRRTYRPRQRQVTTAYHTSIATQAHYERIFAAGIDQCNWLRAA